MRSEELVPIIIAILIIYVGIPLLIVWLKDKSNLFGLIIKRIFGAIALLFGLILLGWVLYNLVSPTPEFRESVFATHRSGIRGTIVTGLSLIGRGILVFGMIIVGWRWLTERRPPIQQEKEQIEEGSRQEAADEDE